jgi:hypothetical protein
MVRPLSRPELVTSAVTGAAALGIYVATLYPDVTGGDSAELINAVAAGGVIHPPGYPLYALLAIPFAHLPVGSLAWGLNLFSAVCDAGAAALLCLTVARWSGRVGAGVLAAALFAFAPGIWRYAISAEVFALNNLFVSLLMCLAVLYAESRDHRLALAGAFTAGLGLGNHQTLVFTALPLAIWVLWKERARFLPLLACLSLGLSIYLYLPIAAARPNADSWGRTDTWAGFWTHVLRREYGTFHLARPGSPSAHGGMGIPAAWLAHVTGQLSWWELLLTGVGLVVTVRAGWRSKANHLGLVAIVPPMLAVAVFAMGGNVAPDNPIYREILARFWEQPDIYVFVWAGLGAAAVADKIAFRWALPVAAAVATVAQLAGSWGVSDGRNHVLVRDFATEILRAAPPDALILTRGDIFAAPVRYVQREEHQHPDVRVVDAELLATSWDVGRLRGVWPELVFPGERLGEGPGGFNVKQLFDANIERRPIVVCGGLADTDTSARDSYELWPVGLCALVRAKDRPLDVDDWISTSDALLPKLDLSSQAHPPGSWEDVIWDLYWRAFEARAQWLLHEASDRPERLQLASSVLEQVAAVPGAATPDDLKTLVAISYRLGIHTPSQGRRLAEILKHYLQMVPDALDRLSIESEIQRLSR